MPRQKRWRCEWYVPGANYRAIRFDYLVCACVVQGCIPTCFGKMHGVKERVGSNSRVQPQGHKQQTCHKAHGGGNAFVAAGEGSVVIPVRGRVNVVHNNIVGSLGNERTRRPTERSSPISREGSTPHVTNTRTVVYRLSPIPEGEKKDVTGISLGNTSSANSTCDISQRRLGQRNNRCAVVRLNIYCCCGLCRGLTTAFPCTKGAVAGGRAKAAMPCFPCRY